MALMNSLLVSWNFDTLSGSDGSGVFTVNDTENNYIGQGINFEPNDTNFLLKEDLKTNRKVFIDTIEGSETIQCLEEDDNRIDALHKPSSVRLLVENSMYQVMSDEMLNLFSTIDAYSFKFAESFNKYRDLYNDLEATRSDFFSKILEKPNVEKYIEFYKWIDSSLGYLLEQLKPENSNVSTGLKNTIESHILERNKYKHQLPLVVQPNRLYTSGIEVIKKTSLDRSTHSRKRNVDDVSRNDVIYVENEDLNTADITNRKGTNFKNNYEVIQVAGKSSLLRSSKENKTVFKSKFSSVDGLSDIYRDELDETSVYNNLNYRASDIKNIFNASQSLSTGIQGQLSGTDFRDNNFIQRNVPYKDENYIHTNSVNYQNIPSEQVEFLHYTNILYDINGTTYEDSKDIVEPPIQFNVPLKMNIKMASGLEFIDTNSPYSSLLDSFSIRNRQKYDGLLDRIYINEYRSWFTQTETFYFKAYDLFKRNILTIKTMENMNVIFPRTDLIGLARIRTKTAYEEERGTFNPAYNEGARIRNIWLYFLKVIPWSNNSYNNESNSIRSFWRSSVEDRLRTRGIDRKLNSEYYVTGAFNTYLYANFKQDIPPLENNIYYNPNIYNSIWSMDCQSDFRYEESGSSVILSCSQEIYGDLAPYSHFYQARFYLANTATENIHLQPKPQFIHNVFLHRTAIDSIDTSIQFIFNNSYQDGVPCNIQPFYNSYEDFRTNIKHKSQNRSIVPEFIASNFDSLINNSFDYREFRIENPNCFSRS